MRNRPTSPLSRLPAYRSLDVTFVKPRLEHIGALGSGRCRRALTAAVGPTFSSSARRIWGHFKTKAFSEELLRAELHWTRKHRSKGEILIISLLRCTYQARILANRVEQCRAFDEMCQRPAYLAQLPFILIAVSTLSQSTVLSSSSKGQGSRLPCSSFVCTLKPPTMICMSRGCSEAKRLRYLACSHYAITPSRMVCPARCPQKKP